MSVESKKNEYGSFIGVIQPWKDRIVIGRVFNPNFGEDQILVDMDFTITNVRRGSTVPILPGFEDFLSKLQEEEKELKERDALRRRELDAKIRSSLPKGGPARGKNWLRRLIGK